MSTLRRIVSILAKGNAYFNRLGRCMVDRLEMFAGLVQPDGVGEYVAKQEQSLHHVV